MSVIARSTDPETSHEAAEAFEASKDKQRSVRTVVEILAAHGELTDFQIGTWWAKYWGPYYSESLPRKARHWAREKGLVRHSGYGEHNGHKVRTWSLGKDTTASVPAGKPVKYKVPQATYLEIIQVLKCAAAGLDGALQAHTQEDIEVHDWKSHERSLEDCRALYAKLEAMA